MPGITPADAGKTGFASPSCRILKDHPRGCGENTPSSLRMPTQGGSPPRMRGKLSLFSGIVRITGITPADAGKTMLLGRRFVSLQDHPRGCGENPILHDFRAVGTGSPPRMRGKPVDDIDCYECTRITPEDAGKTSRRLMASRWSLGSPPRMRGKLRAGRLVDYPAGITPADAGKTRSAFGYIPA